MNAASPSQLGRILGSLYKEENLTVVLDGTFSDFLDVHVEFLTKVLKLSTRPTFHVVQEACI